MPADDTQNIVSKAPEEALAAETLSGSLKAIDAGLQLFEDQTARAANRFAAELLTALGHSTRLRIIALLAEEPLTVNQISAALAVSQANASQHLAILLRAGALVRERQGTARRYRLRGREIARVCDLIEEFRQEYREDLSAELVG